MAGFSTYELASSFSCKPLYPLCYTEQAHRGVAQLGSALLWGSRGREFESRRSDSIKAVQH